MSHDPDEPRFVIPLSIFIQKLQFLREFYVYFSLTYHKHVDFHHSVIYINIRECLSESFDRNWTPHI